ncbi:sensor histidine kinase [bacterium]|nr:sensor histidine kinase [bacterium]
MNLESKVRFLLFTFSLLPMMACSWLFFQTFGESLQIQVQRDFSQLGIQLVREMQNFLESSRRDLEFLSQTRVIREQIMESWDKDGLLRNLLVMFQRYHPEFEEVLCVRNTSKGMKFFSSTNPLRVTLPTEHKYESFASLHERMAQDHLTQPWMHNLDVELSSFGDDSILPVLIAFHSEDEGAHILQGSLSLQTIFDKIRSLTLGGKEQGKDRMILVFDSHGKLLFHPLGESVRNTTWSEILASIERGDFHDRCPGPKGQGQFLFYWKKLPSTDWKILVLFDEKAALLQREHVLHIIFGILILTILATLWISKVLARRVSSPLISLRTAAESIEKSEFDFELSIHSGDEIEDLANSMKSMSKNLKRYQKELEQSALALESQVQDRTHDYLQLVEEYKTLANLLTHDLGNYLSSLGLLVEGLGTKTGEKELRAAIPKLQKLCMDSSTMLKKCSELRALQEGRLEFQPEETSVSELYEDLELLFSQRLRKKDLRFRKQSTEVETLNVDREWFTMSVLANVIGNAIKFSRSSCEITLNCLDRGKRVEFVVCDEGIGMDESLLSQVFDPSVRPIRRGTAGEKGTGFGLLLAKKFLEEMGGSMEIESKSESKLERGFTRVRLFLPR